MRECIRCDWCKDLINSDGEMVYICMNTSSGAYEERIDILGNCDKYSKTIETEINKG